MTKGLPDRPKVEKIVYISMITYASTYMSGIFERIYGSGPDYYVGFLAYNENDLV